VVSRIAAYVVGSQSGPFGCMRRSAIVGAGFEHHLTGARLDHEADVDGTFVGDRPIVGGTPIEVQSGRAHETKLTHATPRTRSSTCEEIRANTVRRG
jgi:hypothetical protein